MVRRFPARTSRRPVAALIALLASVSHANAERLPIKNYTTADGLARNQIIRIERDSRGFLWFCTKEGLSRFDGHTFVNYTQADGLPHRSVRDILEVGDGEYWIATRAGIARWRSGRTPRVEVLSPGDDDPSHDIWRLFRDSNGTIWVGAVAGLFRAVPNRDSVRFIPTDLGMPATAPDTRLVQDIAMDRAGALWVGTRASGLYQRLPDGRTIRYTTNEGLPENRVNALLLDRDGQVWAGTSHGLARLHGDGDSRRFVVDRVFSTQTGLAGNWIDALCQTADGVVWIAGGGGVSTIVSADSGAPVRSYGVPEGVTTFEAATLMDDRAGNLWIGTADNGALKLSRDGLTQYGKPDGLGAQAVGGIFAGPDNTVAIYNYAVVSTFDGRRFTRTRVNFGRRVQPTPWGFGRVALRDRSGALWLATNDGLFRFSGIDRIEDLSHLRPTAIYDSRHGLAADSVLLLYEDTRGDIWILSDTGWHPMLTRWSRATGEFHEFSDGEGWPSGTWITDFAEDGSGALWIAGTSLVRYRDGRFRRFTTADGLPTDAVQAVHVDHAGRLWLATDTKGVMRVDDPSTDHLSGPIYSTATGLASDETMNLAEDAAGRMYVVTGRGVDRLDLASGGIRHYTGAEGLAFGPLAFRDASGNLWFGSSRELSRLVPTDDARQEPPSAWIGSVRVEGVPRAMPELGVAGVTPLAFGANERQVSVDFFGIGERLRYEYRLVGADDKWSQPTDQRTVHYASLSPGRYRFEVRAIATDSGLRSSPATVAFMIPPPIWLRWWFLTLVAAAVAIALYAAHRRRLAHLLEVERVRTRIATDLHDDLGANLSRVAILSEVVKQRIGQSDGQSVSLLTEIGDSSRSLMGSLRDLVWAIDPAGGSPDDVDTRIRQIASTLLDPKGITWTLHSGGDSRQTLDSEQRRHVMLFFKEGINNAARYSDASRIDLSVEQTRDAIVCSIVDDGQGFDVGSASAHGGRGLRNMRTRAGALGGRMDILSTPGAGTTLTLTVPLARRAVGA